MTYVAKKEVTKKNKDPQKLPLKCVAEYVQDFITEEDRKKLFETLMKKLPWENHGMRRDTVLFGDEGIQYHYGKGYGQESTPQPWIPELFEIKKMLEKYLNAKFNICLCGLYLNGSKSIGFHCDREELGKKTPIASISLGAERWFEFREKGWEEGSGKDQYRMILHNGSLLVMGEFCQDRYLHSLPPDKAIKTGRINLTFRNSVGDVDPDSSNLDESLKHASLNSIEFKNE